MLLIELEIKEGEILPMLFKSDPKEITLREYVDMKLLFEDAPPHIKSLFLPELEESEVGQMQFEGNYVETAPQIVEQPQSPSEWDATQQMQWLEFMGKVVALFCYVETEKGLRKADLSDALLLPMSDESADNLGALFTLLHKNILGYKEQPIRDFTHKGKSFVVPQNMVDNFGNTTYAADISGIEAVEALQLEHVLNGKKSNGTYALKDRLYHSDLGVIAAICRMVDWQTGRKEQMPLEFVERRTFIDNRVKFFSDLPMTTALDVCFFFVNSNPICKLTPILQNFLTTKQAIFNKLEQWK